MTIDASYEKTPEGVKQLVQGHAAPERRFMMKSITYKIGDIYVWIFVSRKEPLIRHARPESSA